jgi:hypothetical protein
MIVIRHIAVLAELNYAPRVHIVSSHNLMMLCFFLGISSCGSGCTEFSPVSRRLVRQTFICCVQSYRNLET